MANEQNLKPQPFRKGADARRNLEGRPRKFISSLKALGYKQSEINDAITTLLSLTRAELSDIDKNPNATVLELMLSSSILKSIKDGRIDIFETLISRRFGKPTEKVEISQTQPEIVAARSLYDSLIEHEQLAPKQALKRVLMSAATNGYQLTEKDILDADTLE